MFQGTPKFWLKAWDALVWILIVFPLVTGGIWLHRPGLKIELSEMAVPVVIVTLLGFWLYRRGTDLRASTAVRGAEKIARIWNREISRAPARALLLATLAVGALWAWASVRRHSALGTGAADLGIFTNAIWNLAFRGEYVSSVKNGINLFLDHQSPVFWLWAPVFRMFPAPETLLITQSFLLASGGAAVWFLARPYLETAPGTSKRILSALPWVYWAYPAIRSANAFDFHPESIILPAFLWGLAGMHSGRRSAQAAGAFALLIGLLGKESAGPILAGIGLAWGCGAAPATVPRARGRIWGVAAILIGTGTFIFETHVIPQLMGGHYAYSSLYSSLSDPSVLASRLFGWARFKFLIFMLAPLGFLPLFGGRAAVAAVPGFLMLFLSDGDHRLNPIYHYGIEPAVGLFWALPLALSRIAAGEICFHRLTLDRAQLVLLICTLAFFGRSEMVRVRRNSPTDHDRWIRSELISALDPDAAIAASGSLVPHLALRPWVHHLPILKKTDDRWVDCVVLDPSVGNWPLPGDQLLAMPETLHELSYELEFRCGALSIWKHRDAVRSCLTRLPPCADEKKAG